MAYVLDSSPETPEAGFMKAQRIQAYSRHLTPAQSEKDRDHFVYDRGATVS